MPLPLYLVDTSVALKWVLGRAEADVRRALGLLEASSRKECSLSAPDLLLVEFANVLIAAHRQEPARVREALDFLNDIGMRILPLRRSALNRAVDLAATLRAAIYDCYFLAIAIESDATLVTADEAFLRRIRPHPHAIALRDLSNFG